MIEFKEWESAATGLRWGEVLFDLANLPNLDRSFFQNLSEESKLFDCVVLRLKIPFNSDNLKNKKIYSAFSSALAFSDSFQNSLKREIELMGFSFVDEKICVLVNLKEIQLDIQIDKWKNLCFDFFSGENSISCGKISHFLELVKIEGARKLKEVSSYRNFSWAEEIYRRWIDEILLEGAFGIVHSDYGWGFAGSKIFPQERTAKFILLFSDKIPSFVIIKRFFDFIMNLNVQIVEAKISLLLNKKFALLLANSISKNLFWKELIFMRVNSKVKQDKSK
ncbi:hypothetical protein HRbin19_00330 [bacterium HR19]|nr:hypothetical protein HRbin19_00330 [bacterium HR19]